MTGNAYQFMPHFYQENLNTQTGAADRSFSKFLENHFDFLRTKGPDGDNSTKSTLSVSIPLTRQMVKHGVKNAAVHFFVRQFFAFNVVFHNIHSLDRSNPVKVLAHFDIDASPSDPALTWPPGHDPDELEPPGSGIPATSYYCPHYIAL